MAVKVASAMLIVDIAISLALINGLGQIDLLSLSLALLPPAWSALVFSFLISSYPPIRPASPLQFPAYITYPLISAALVFSISVLICAKSPSIVALESEAFALKLWTNYPFVVLSAISKIVLLSVWSFVASRRQKAAEPGDKNAE